MKAAVYHKYGAPEVVEVTQLEKPSPKRGEVLINVHYTTVNRNDCGFRKGLPLVVRAFSGLLQPKIPVLGTEFSGIVRI